MARLPLGIVMRTSRLAGVWVVVAGLLWASGCLDGDRITEPLEQLPALESPVLVSDPVSNVSSAGPGAAVSLAQTGTNLAYISLPPGTVPDGELAIIRNSRSGTTVTAEIVAGGFDPVAVEAVAGDTLEIQVQASASTSSIRFLVIVPPIRRPVVVRTDPPPRKRDVPLNMTILIVFSEPIDGRTITSETIRLLLGGQPVAGRRVLSGDGLRVEFQPEAPLAPATDYTLSITTGLADLTGDPLEPPPEVTFTTESVPAPVASVTVDPPALTLEPGETLPLTATAYDSAGNVLTGRVVTWFSGDPAVATVSTTGAVTALSLGSTTVTAAVEDVSATAAIEVIPAPPRILVDASRDGGVWWYPQWAQEGGFDPSLPHQGKVLADHLRSIGYRVDELPRPYTITSGLLQTYDMVIRAGVYGTYASGEITAYQDYVNGGGNLLLLADHMMQFPPDGRADGLALSFGLQFAGITRGENLLSSYVAHPITNGVDALGYMVGSGLLSYPASAEILGSLSAESYLDLNNNDVQDAGEPSAPAVFGVMTHGAGRIVFFGDTNTWEQIPQPLLSNTLAWFEEP